MKNSLLLITLGLFASVGFSQTTTINVTSPGTLATLVGDQKNVITDLTVTGSLNGDDIIVLREMAGITKSGAPSQGKMSNLDMSGASIVPGGAAYMYDYSTYAQFYTKQDTLNTNTFFNCPALQTVTLPASLKAVEKRVFSVCGNLKSINVPASNTSLKSIDGVLYSTVDRKLLRYPTAHLGETFTIPGDVEIVGYEAFADCLNLLSIVLPEGVTTIEGVAFTFCKKIAAMDIPASVTSIASSAFNYCTGLTDVNVAEGNTVYKSENGVLFNKAMTEILRFPMARSGAYVIPSTVTTVGEYAFDMSSKVTSITMPENLEKIGKYGFYSCSKVTEIHLPNTVNFIGNGAFGFCSALKVLELPDALTEIGDWCFSGCKALPNVVLPATLVKYGEGAFSDCYALTSIAVPEGTTVIPASFCSGSKALANVSLPSTVTNIGQYAFFSCSGMKTLYCYAVQPPQCGFFPFYYVDKAACTLYVPKASVDAYKADNVFKEFNIIEGIEPSGIVGPQVDEVVPVAVYTLDGRVAPANYSGVVIQVMSNGTTRKVLVK